MTTEKPIPDHVQAILARPISPEFKHHSDGVAPKSAAHVKSYENGNRIYGPPIATEAQTVAERIQKGFVGVYIREEAPATPANG